MECISVSCFYITNLFDVVYDNKLHWKSNSGNYRENLISRMPLVSCAFKRAIQNVTVRASFKSWPKVHNFVVRYQSFNHLISHPILTILVPLTWLIPIWSFPTLVSCYFEMSFCNLVYPKKWFNIPWNSNYFGCTLCTGLNCTLWYSACIHSKSIKRRKDRGNIN